MLILCLILTLNSSSAQSLALKHHMIPPTKHVAVCCIYRVVWLWVCYGCDRFQLKCSYICFTAPSALSPFHKVHTLSPEMAATIIREAAEEPATHSFQSLRASRSPAHKEYEHEQYASPPPARSTKQSEPQPAAWVQAAEPERGAANHSGSGHQASGLNSQFSTKSHLLTHSHWLALIGSFSLLQVIDDRKGRRLYLRGG